MISLRETIHSTIVSISCQTWAKLDWIQSNTYAFSRINKIEFESSARKISRAPVPVFRICSTSEAQISMWKGLEAAAVRVSLDHKSRCSPAKNAKHLKRVAWICGVATIPSDVLMSGDENPQWTSRSPPRTWRYSSGLRRGKSCRVSVWWGSSLWRPPFSPKPVKSKTVTPTGGFLFEKNAKSDSTKRKKEKRKR